MQTSGALALPDAPSDGNTYGRRNTAWNSVDAMIAPVAANATAALHDAGRNLVTNGTFVVAQRGAGPWTTNGAFTADRWWLSITTDTLSASLISLADADRSQIGDESAWNGYQVVFTGNAAAGANSCLTQSTEDVRRFSNKTATVSFWAKAAAGTPNLGVTWYQNFGSGGSPSAIVLGTGVAVTLSTTWTRYTRTITFPSISGKTLGTNNDHATCLRFGFSSGATNASFLGVGVQSGTIQIWGVQLEIGTQATPLDAGGSPQQILAECQRFYFASNFAHGGNGLAGVTESFPVYWPVAMRATPTITLGTPSNSINYPAPPTVLMLAVANGFLLNATIPANGGFLYGNNYTASADL